MEARPISLSPATPRSGRIRLPLTQENIVFGIAVALFVVFSTLLPNFLTSGNILALIRSVSVLGILGIGMAIVVIGRGIDLAIIAIMAISVAWALQLANTGMPLALSLPLGLAFALACGVVAGVTIAYLDVPPLFATLAMAAVVSGFGHLFLLPLDQVQVPRPKLGETLDISWVGAGSVLHIPVPILIFAAVAALAFVFLRGTKIGRFIYGVGDNLAAARITGVPARPVLVLQYVLSAATAYVAGVITATSVSSLNTRVVNSTLIYDVILVVVLGGIGLSGGRGGVRNVVVGTLLIGILLNGMTIMDVQYTLQNLVKSLILLAAIVIDSVLNPRDEQTAQQGDI